MSMSIIIKFQRQLL